MQSTDTRDAAIAALIEAARKTCENDPYSRSLQPIRDALRRLDRVPPSKEALTMPHIIYTADKSATARGWVGLVIDSSTQRVVTRTIYAYARRELAITAVMRMHLWGVKQEDAA